MKFNPVWYVLNYNPNKKRIVPYNIFNNCEVNEKTLDLCKNYNGNFITFVKELNSIIMWQEWSRREYEISVGDAFETDCGKLEKWDCYSQAHMNIELIADYVLRYYKENFK